MAGGKGTTVKRMPKTIATTDRWHWILNKYNLPESCPYCNRAMSYAYFKRKRPTDYDEHLKICRAVPCISQITITQYVQWMQERQVRDQLEGQIDEKTWERMRRTQISYGIIKDDRTLWQKITQLFQKI